uniref:Olfactory receptor class A related 3, tandem duplicate 1 n=1 Tax=Oryzias latipes TaxID=8090 RepID=A0A3B3HBB5_ORYLA
MSAVSRMKTQLDLRPADEAAAKIKDFVGPEGRDENPKHVGIGLQVPVSDVQIVCHVIMVVLAILGNATVIVVIGKSVIQDRRVAHNSNIIIINMAVSNLMVSIMRNILLIVSDFGIQLFLSRERCQFLMGVWVWLRSVNVWSTFYLSVFHLQTLRRVAPSVGNLQASRGVPKTLLLNLLSIWILNLLYSIPAHIFSTNGNANSTETLMLISSTTRPLLGCVWNFPSSYSGLAYATTSMVIHETLPIVLMTVTNLSSLYTLHTYGRTRKSVQDAPVVKRVPAEKRAAKVRKRMTAYVQKRFLDPPMLQICYWIIQISFSCFPGDSYSCFALHCVLGNQRYICKLLQLQPRHLIRVPPGHRSLCPDPLHRLVSCCPGGWPSWAAFLYQVIADLLTELPGNCTPLKLCEENIHNC